MILLALDPGFDATGWAVFDLAAPPRTLQDAVSGLKEAGEIITKPADPDALRLSQIGGQVHFLLTMWNPAGIAVEVPSYSGTYGRNTASRASLNKLFMAIGAILSRAPGERVLTVPALTTPKETRHELLANAARMVAKELPTGPRGGSREDAWDAIWLGCQVLLERWSSINPLERLNHALPTPF